MKNKNRYRGQTLVEFALILPLFLLLVMALFDVGRYVLYFAVLNTAVREGARHAIVQPLADYNKPENTGNFLSDATEENPQVDEEIPLTDCSAGACDAHDSICSEVKDKTFNLPTISDAIMTITHGRSNDKPTINILLEVTYRPITPGLGLLGVTNITVDSQMQMIYARFQNFEND